ncbi:receptor like protein 21-like [Mangifera indica]|uniref:receptor like protein 21-like n=1 Tax=Mangifera indica TaxID=29780 RepID=UPI001CFAA291|nr:receptor like protein 21-like [Mangifera indica]
MMERLLIKLLLMVSIVLVQAYGFKGFSEKERIGLLELKSFIKSVSNYETEKILVSWVDDKTSNYCEWERVQCNTTTRHVIKLSLNFTRQFYSIRRLPTLNLSLFHPFEELRSLDLSGNDFGGWHENKANDGFRSLKQLEILDFHWNYFNVTLLSYLTTLTTLITLNLKGNSLGEGLKSVKQGFASMKNLQALDLSDNQINGHLSNLGLGNLTNLKRLDLSVNEINTSLANLGLANMTKLKILDLSDNQINTSLASLGLVNLTKLKILDLSGNQIVNAKGLKYLKNLEQLYMESNEMSGDALTLGPANLTNLKVLDLRYNHVNNSLESLGICELKNLAELHLGFNIFDGHHSKCLHNLSNLKVLDLSGNQLSGNFLSFVAHDLTSLEYLSLSHNNLEGFSTYDLFQPASENRLPTYQLKGIILQNCSLDVMPRFLSYHYNLRYIDLSNNKLVGNFPVWLLENCTKLQDLSLRNNSFSGTFHVPKSKCNLRLLNIASNNFTDQLPENIGIILPSLSYIDMSKNLLQGKIPSSMGEMKRLSTLDLSSNNFSGELPDNFVNGCFSLRILRLSNNKFQGQIFPRRMNLTRLEWLYLDNNTFSGKIGNGLLNATSLFFLDISNNKVAGQIPQWIDKIPSLIYLLMSNNLLEGTLPIELSNLEALSMLDVSENRLSGSIPCDFNLSVNHLYMQKNSLSGSIPNSLFENSKLVTLDLRDNKFSGNIDPRWFNHHSTLHFLLLSDNHLQGSIPNQLCQLMNLGLLDLSYNKLNGSIPSCFTNLTCWKMVGDIDCTPFISTYSWEITNDELEFSSDSAISSFYMEEGFYESLDTEIFFEVEFTMKNRLDSYKGYTFENIVGLDLSNNELAGEIPSTIGELQGIIALNLSYNFLSGPIPKSFAHMREIESLDLSHNKLRGQIPPQLTQLYNLEVFHVAHNNLSGPIPNQFQFETFNEDDFEGNPYLCGRLIKKNCTNVALPPSSTIVQDEDNDDESIIDMIAFDWSFTGSYSTTITVLIMIIWINPYWRRVWFDFIDACIYLCFYWFVKYVWH